MVNGQRSYVPLFLASFLLFVLVSLDVVTVPTDADAEWLVDIYLGAAFTQSEDLVVRVPELDDLKATYKGVGFDTSASFGGRLGYWFESAPYLGLALDAFHFQPDLSGQTRTVKLCDIDGCETDRLPFDKADLDVTAISFDVMLRWSLLTTKELPKGQLQPYLSMGPAIFIARVKDSVNFADPPNQSDTDTSMGLKAGAGLAWEFRKNVALFTEYRFTHFSPEVEFRPDGFKTTVESNINTHHLLGGISLRF